MSESFPRKQFLKRESLVPHQRDRFPLLGLAARWENSVSLRQQRQQGVLLDTPHRRGNFQFSFRASEKREEKSDISSWKLKQQKSQNTHPGQDRRDSLLCFIVPVYFGFSVSLGKEFSCFGLIQFFQCVCACVPFSVWIEFPYSVC